MVNSASNQTPVIAYFSMEIGLDPSVPTYAGGLGILAGDSLLAASDLGLPIVGVTLLHRKGYFQQHLDDYGNQSESPVEWRPEEKLKQLPARASVTIEGRQVWLSAWQYTVRGVSENDVPVYFLDTRLPENSDWDQTLTDYLYGGDDHYRLCQEVVLGLGGMAMLEALGYHDIAAYHMNEGHSAMLTLGLLTAEMRRTGLPASAKENRERVRSRCVFTTHTPVPAGIDRFPASLARKVLGDQFMNALVEIDCLHNETLNLTFLALFFSRYINGVSMEHGEISHGMYPGYPINSVSNGVHLTRWAAESFHHLFDRHVPEWRHDNLYLRYIINVPLEEIRQAHLEAKQALLAEVQKRTGNVLNPSVMTLGFARRMTAYKRADLIFSDLERLKRIARQAGPIQIVYSGKAHPRDDGGKEMIRHVFQAAASLKGTVDVIFIEDYDMALAKYMCSGVDLWINTPQRPYEASGTSGMKAAVNGVPSLSILDGWWVEGHLENVTGWAIGESKQDGSPAREAASLYDKLENTIVPMFYRQPSAFDAVMRSTIAINASYYNAQRMMFQYLEHAYTPYH